MKRVQVPHEITTVQISDDWNSARIYSVALNGTPIGNLAFLYRTSRYTRWVAVTLDDQVLTRAGDRITALGALVVEVQGKVAA